MSSGRCNKQKPQLLRCRRWWLPARFPLGSVNVVATLPRTLAFPPVPVFLAEIFRACSSDLRLSLLYLHLPELLPYV